MSTILVAPVRPDGSGARVAYVSMGPVPAVVDLGGAAPAGPGWDPAGWAKVAARATEGLEPEGDVHATADYRLHLARVLTARALAQAWSASGPGREGEAAA